MHLFQLLLNNLIFGIIYSLNWRFFEQFKISSKPWPWRSEKAWVREEFKATVWRAIGRVFINNVFIGLPLSFVSYHMNKDSGAFSTSLEDWPSTWTIIWQIGVRFCACASGSASGRGGGGGGGGWRLLQLLDELTMCLQATTASTRGIHARRPRFQLLLFHFSCLLFLVMIGGVAGVPGH